jgi:hypothetical protein
MEALLADLRIYFFCPEMDHQDVNKVGMLCMFYYLIEV